jgi:hypothetical protein
MSPLDPTDALREQFAAAAAREIGADQQPHAVRRRKLRRAAIAFAVVGVGSGGIATAVDLISTGEPAPGNPDISKVYGVTPGGGTVAVTAPDPDGGLDWGVLAYTSKPGLPCAIVGQVRGAELGVVEDGKFRPYGTRAGSVCGPLKDRRVFWSPIDIGNRSLIFGRASAGVRALTVTVKATGRRYSAKPGPKGAFLFVFEKGLRFGNFTFDVVGK